MNLSFKWLGEYLDTSKFGDMRSYCEAMTASGSKVEGFEEVGKELINVVVGKILSTEKHPDADRLTICSVDIGKDEPIQIVTAATNMKVSDLVPVALDGAVLCNDIKIKSGKLRGVVSQGMFCSIEELGLTENDMPYADPNGILILKEDCKCGDDIREVLLLRDTVVEFEITPNRQDCFSVIGLARETAATYGLTANIPTPKNISGKGNVKDYVDVEVREPDLCQRYCARAITNVKVGPSPLWLRSRLRMMGIRPINNIVDITNYVLLEYGQPMHAFDYDFIEGKKIIVRRAEENESIVTLDSKQRKLNSSMLLISDEKKPIALAGVMGGENSQIKSYTKTVIFESATFDCAAVRLASRTLGLRSDSSALFEKGLDSDNAILAINRACELVEMLGAGEVVDGMIDVYPVKREKVELKFEPERINAFLGTDISREKMVDILSSLEFVIDGDKITVPHYRQDVLCFADIAEEIARMYGYNSIESTKFKCNVEIGALTEEQSYRKMLESLCVSLGLQEVLTYSFISPKTYDLLGLPEDSKYRNSIKILNPLGEDTSVMRTTAFGSMMDVISHNKSFKNDNGAFFEMAKVYNREENGEITEKIQLVIGAYDFGGFYSLKGIVEKILEKTLGKSKISEPLYDISAYTDSPFFHSGRCARATVQDNVLCEFGEVNPEILRNYSVDTRAYIAVFDINTLYDNYNVKKTYKALPKFPATLRDLAFVCSNDVSVGDLMKVIVRYGGKKIEDVKLFDIYTGDRIGEGKKSLAFNITLRDYQKTLSENEIDAIVKKIIFGAEKELGATLRS